MKQNREEAYSNLSPSLLHRTALALSSILEYQYRIMKILLRSPESTSIVNLMLAIILFAGRSAQGSLILPGNFTALDSPSPVDILVFPKDPARVTTVKNLIESIIDNGQITTVETRHRPDFAGIEFWRLQIDDTQLASLQSQLRDGDVCDSYQFECFPERAWMHI